MEQPPIPPARTQRRRAAFVLLTGAILGTVAVIALRRTGRWESTSGFMVVVATFLAADGLRLITEWWKPHWFQPPR